MWCTLVVLTAVRVEVLSSLLLCSIQCAPFGMITIGDNVMHNETLKNLAPYLHQMCGEVLSLVWKLSSEFEI